MEIYDFFKDDLLRAKLFRFTLMNTNISDFIYKYVIILGIDLAQT